MRKLADYSWSKKLIKTFTLDFWSQNINFKIIQAKMTKYVSVNCFWLADFKFLTEFELNFVTRILVLC